MRKNRLVLIPALAVGLFGLSACFQLPSSDNTDTSQSSDESDTSSSDSSSDDGGSDLATELNNTDWSASTTELGQLEFTLNEDGTVDFSTFGDSGPFDAAGDVWSVDGDEFSMTITEITDQSTGDVFDITYSGTAATGSMSLTGTATDGSSGYTLDMTQG